MPRLVELLKLDALPYGSAEQRCEASIGPDVCW